MITISLAKLVFYVLISAILAVFGCSYTKNKIDFIQFFIASILGFLISNLINFVL